MNWPKLIDVVRITGGIVMAVHAALVMTLGVIVQTYGAPELDAAQWAFLVALCFIGPFSFAWASMKADIARQEIERHEAQDGTGASSGFREAA